MTYRERWTRVWLIIDAFGVGLAFLIWQPSTLAFPLALTTTFAAIMLLLFGPTTDATRPDITIRTWLHHAGTAMALGGAVIAAAALIAVFWPLAVLLALSAGASSPWVVARFGRGNPDPQPVTQEAVEELPQIRHPGTFGVTPVAVQALSTTELCHAWRRSFVVLLYATTTEQRLGIVTARQIYLDEMERRSPTALHAWLASGARAAGSPDRYLGDNPDSPGRSAAA